MPRDETPITNAADPVASVMVLLADGKAGLRDAIDGRLVEVREMEDYLARLQPDPNPEGQYARVAARRDNRAQDLQTLQRVNGLLDQVAQALTGLSELARAASAGVAPDVVAAIQAENSRLEGSLAEAHRLASEWADRATRAEHARASAQVQVASLTADLEKLQRENAELVTSRYAEAPGTPAAAAPADGAPLSWDGPGDEDLAMLDALGGPAPARPADRDVATALAPVAASWPGMAPAAPAPAAPPPPAPAPREGPTVASVAADAVARRAALGAGIHPEAVLAVSLVREHFLSGADPIPPFPPLPVQVVEMLSVPGMGTNELCQAIDGDLPVTTQVLRVINGGAFPGVPELKGLRAAAVRLGLRDVANLAVAVAAAPVFIPPGRTAPPALQPLRRQVLQEAVTVALATSSVASTLKLPSAQAFLAALLHDVGKAFVLRSLATLLAKGKLAAAPPAESLAWLLEETHPELGMGVVDHWALPDTVQAVVAHQHTPAPPEDAALATVHLVRVVSGLHQVHTNPRYRVSLEDEVNASLRALNLTAVHVKSVLTQLKAATTKAEALVKACG